MYSDIRDIELEIDAWLDRKNAIEPLVISGPDNLTTQVAGAPDGTYQREPRNIRVVVRAMLTDLARRNGRIWQPATWSGYVSHDVAMVMEDCVMAYAPLGSGVQASMPLIEMRNFRHVDTDNNNVDGARYQGDINAATQIRPVGPSLCYSFTGGPHLVTLSNVPAGGIDHGYAHGQMLRIYAVSNASNPGEGMFFRKAEPWSWLRLKQDRLLSRTGDYIELRYNRHYQSWEETDFRTSADTVLAAKVAGVAIPALASGASDEIVLGLTGAVPGDPVLAGLDQLSGGIVVSACVSAPDKVTLTLFNAGASASAAATADVSLRIER